MFNGAFNVSGQIDAATLTKNINQLISETKNSNTIRFAMKSALLFFYSENKMFKDAEKIAIDMLNDSDIFHASFGNAQEMEKTKEGIRKSLRYIYHRLKKHAHANFSTINV